MLNYLVRKEETGYNVGALIIISRETDLALQNKKN